MDGARPDDERQTAEVREDDRETVAWDAHQVWRERVREARRDPLQPGLESRRQISPGWDPLETWRDRVLRPRSR